VTVVNYRNREAAYHNTNYGWAKQVRQQPVNAGRVQGQRPPQNNYNDPNPYARQSSGERSSGNPYARQSSGERSSGNPYARSSQPRTSNAQVERQSPPPSASQKNSKRLPPNYNTPVTSSPQRAQQGQRAAQYQPDNRQKMQHSQGQRQQAAPTPQGNNSKNKGKYPGEDDGTRTRGYR
jgi:hypothetical protein